MKWDMLRFRNKRNIIIERDILIECQGMGFTITLSKSFYILIPSEIAQTLIRDFHFDLKNRDIEKKCTLAIENDLTGKKSVRLIYEFL